MRNTYLTRLRAITDHFNQSHDTLCRDREFKRLQGDLRRIDDLLPVEKEILDYITNH